MAEIRFTLYVAGKSSRSQAAIANLNQLAELRLSRSCTVTIIDVTEDPEAAERARILTTPTLVKESPTPQRRVIGDLSDAERVLLGLALDAGDATTDQEIPIG